MRRVVRVMVDAAALLAVAGFVALSVVPGAAVPGAGPRAAEVPAAEAPSAEAPAAGGAATDSARADESVRTHILEQGTAETGSLNLVTAIYLGYRAYDTLGETVVLLLAVSGIVYLVGAKR